jgi:hypothetical protein
MTSEQIVTYPSHLKPRSSRAHRIPRADNNVRRQHLLDEMIFDLLSPKTTVQINDTATLQGKMKFTPSGGSVLVQHLFSKCNLHKRKEVSLWIFEHPKRVCLAYAQN